MAPSTDAFHDFKVIIVGGGIGGLTLVHALWKTGIDFVCLEGRDNITPQEGASVGLLPHGSRILDQLGVFDGILAQSSDLTEVAIHSAEGRLFNCQDIPNLVAIRTGYPSTFLQRQQLLEVLFDETPPEAKTRVLTQKRVSKIYHTETNVTVQCKDGSTYTGDVVVGADGVHSIVRQAMREHSETITPGLMDKDKDSMTIEYELTYGIGSHQPDLSPTTLYRTMAEKYSFLTKVGDKGQTMWFLYNKLDKKYKYGEAPRAKTREQINESIQPYLSASVNEHVKLRDVYESSALVKNVLIEEGQNEYWTYDRFVLLGDSICKMTPNMGAGGSSAIESVAVLTNNLVGIANSNPDLESIKRALRNYQSQRRDQANMVCDIANDFTHFEALDSWAHKLTLNIMPYLGDSLADDACQISIGATKIESLPPPKRSLQATMPWNQELGLGRKESYLKRALYALPFFGLFYLARTCMTVVPAWDDCVVAVESGKFRADDGSTIEIHQFTNSKGLNDLLRLFVTIFTPSFGWLDVPHALQTLDLLIDLYAVLTVWNIESIRRGNYFTFATVPGLFAITYQLYGIGKAAPIYCFLHYVLCPQGAYAAADNRLTKMSWVKTLLPTLLLTYLPPTFLMFYPGISLSTRQYINVYWQFTPILLSIPHRMMAFFVKDTTQEDRKRNPAADMPYLRVLYATSILITTTAYLFVIMKSPVPVLELFFADTLTFPLPAKMTITAAMKRFMKFDQIMAFAAHFLWVLYSFGDLKRARKTQASWVKILASLVGSAVVGGYGTALVVMWWWREEIMARYGTSKPTVASNNSVKAKKSA